MNIIESTRAYEDWLKQQLRGDIVAKDLKTKHKKMREAVFPFLRATYWRWAETILEICPELENAPSVLAVGDIHLENFGTWRDLEGRLVWGVNDFDEAAEMPYALDLVRLATSALLGCPGIDSDQDICAQILRGYARGLANPGPILLDHDHAWMRPLFVVSDEERARFWEKLEDPPPREHKPAPRYRRALAAAMPERKLAFAMKPRIAGAGSLGRPRWVAIAQWHNGPLVREAKAAVPSAWTRVHGRGAPRLRCQEIATSRHRAPDPWYAAVDQVIVRRLSPNNRKIEAENDPQDLASRKMLRAMGHELAAVHLGTGNRQAAIQEDLSARESDWLCDAVERAADFVRREQKAWRRADV